MYVPLAPAAGGGAAPARRRASVPLPKGVALRLANLSLLCEALETTGWEPPARWAHDQAVDGGCG